MTKYTCNNEVYIRFLQSTIERYTALTCAHIAPINISHDAISRWLRNTEYNPNTLWEEIKDEVLEKSGILIVDDTVISKPRSEKLDLVQPIYSGAEHAVVKGINVTSLLWKGYDQNENFFCLDHHVYQPQKDNKTKNQAFQDMFFQAYERGVRAEYVVADTWYSSLDNLKLIRKFNTDWIMGLRKNRRVNKGSTTLQDLDIPKHGLEVHLRGYGWIKVFLIEAQNGRKDYIGTSNLTITREDIVAHYKSRWSVEVYHRELKQVYGLGKCQSHTGRAQRNHIGLVIHAWTRNQFTRIRDNISHYLQKWRLIQPALSLSFQSTYFS